MGPRLSGGKRRPGGLRRDGDRRDIGDGRRLGGRPFVVIVGASLLGAMLWLVAIVSGPLLGLGLGLLAGVAVLALLCVPGREEPPSGAPRFAPGIGPSSQRSRWSAWSPWRR